MLRARTGITVKKIIFLAGMGGVAAAAITAALVLPLDSKGHSVSTAEAHAFLSTQIPNTLSIPPGKVLHTKTSVYYRFGPKSQEIVQKSGITTENTVRESWATMGTNDTVTDASALLTDATGKLLQRSTFGTGTSRVTDGSGKVLSENSPLGPMQLNAPMDRATRLDKAVTSGVGKPISQTSTELTIEIKEPYGLPRGANPLQGMAQSAPPFSGPDQAGSFSVPYFADLNPQSLLTRVTIRNDGAVLSNDVYAITASGSQVLISSEKMTTYEVFDQMPANIP